MVVDRDGTDGLVVDGFCNDGRLWSEEWWLVESADGFWVAWLLWMRVRNGLGCGGCDCRKFTDNEPDTVIVIRDVILSLFGDAVADA
jgi:hypothetical protein